MAPFSIFGAMRYFFFILLFLISEQAFCQWISGRITDAQTGEPLAFVAVVEDGTTNGAYTDIDGFFRLGQPNENSLILFNYVGYRQLRMPWNGENPWVVQMHTVPFLTNEVIIRPGENPAERIMRKVISAKDENNPEKRTAFSYESYNKLVLTAEIDSSQFQDKSKLAMEAEEKRMMDYFSDKHLFIMESATSRKFMPPDRSEEVILANKVSGLRNPMFAMLGTQIQSFSFYGESVSVLDINYLSPLSDGAIRKYLFVLEDTTYLAADTVFTISFRPRKDKNFDGMKGQLFIHSNGYAIQQVIAEPFEADASLQIRIQQQYLYTEAGWFPDQLNSFMRFPNLRIGSTEVIGIGKSYIRNLKYDQSYRTRDFSPVVLFLAPSARAQSDSVWNDLRVQPLDQKELNTYHVVDSIGKEEQFDRKVEMLGMLSTGKLPIGKVSLDIDRLFRFNNFEGWRLGAGLHTNDFLSRRFSFGGYYAFGTRDKGHKGGADLLVFVNRQRNLKWTLSWERDVIETGGRALNIDAANRFLSSDYYPFFINRMDQYEKWESSFGGRLIGNLSADLFANTQDIRPLNGSASRTIDNLLVSSELKDIPIAETGVRLRWAPGERLVATARGEMRLGGKYPILNARITKAWDGLLIGTWDYWRLDGVIEKPFRITNGGIFQVRIAGGMISEDVPSSLMYNLRGTNNLDYAGGTFLGISAPNTFETMRTNEFMMARYAALHVRHQFRDLLLKLRRFRPHISIVHNMVLGDRIQNSQFNLDTKALSKPFVESGVVIDRLIVSSFSGLGIGFFYRYGAHALPKASENFVAKLSFSLAF